MPEKEEGRFTPYRSVNTVQLECIFSKKRKNTLINQLHLNPKPTRGSGIWISFSKKHHTEICLANTTNIMMVNFSYLFLIAQSHWISLFSHGLKITWDWRWPPNICWITVVSWVLGDTPVLPPNSSRTADCIASIANLPSRQFWL